MSAIARPLLIVGDRFFGFSGQEGVLTVSQFIDELGLGVYSLDDRPIVIQAGQGVTSAERQSIHDHARLFGLAERLDFRYHEPALAARNEAHKHDSCNTLIADLQRLDVDLFAANLRVHNDNELLIDHQTGEHVQGMVAIEAARQMFLAVSERYHASRYSERNYYYVIESMNTAFENFLFPLDATIEFRTVKAELDEPSRLSFAAEISILQAGRRSSLTEVAYTAFESHVIEAKEHKRARFAVDQIVAAVPVQELIAA